MSANERWALIASSKLPGYMMDKISISPDVQMLAAGGWHHMDCTILLSELQANRIVDIDLEKLAANVSAVVLGAFSTGSMIGNYLLKLGVGMMNSAVLDIPLKETALIVIFVITAMLLMCASVLFPLATGT
ncbi:MAG: hypothetical protein PHF31_01730 [Methylobacter sp.]|nr:hypothetical protein [Methylobacter sp.]